MHFLEQILSFAKTDPEKLAIIYENDALTFAELAQQVAMAQSSFNASGVEKGQAVALVVSNPLQRLPALLALIGMGVTTINCIETSTLPAVALGASTFITGRQLALPANCRQIIVDHKWNSDGQNHKIMQALFDQDQPAAVWFSSGSTGMPRAIASSWLGLVNLVANRQWRTKCARYERVAIAPALSIYFGCSEALSFLASGVTVVSLHSPADILQTAELLAFDYLVMSAAQMK